MTDCYVDVQGLWMYWWITNFSELQSANQAPNLGTVVAGRASGVQILGWDGGFCHSQLTGCYKPAVGFYGERQERTSPSNQPGKAF